MCVWPGQESWKWFQYVQVSVCSCGKQAEQAVHNTLVRCRNWSSRLRKWCKQRQLHWNAASSWYCKCTHQGATSPLRLSFSLLRLPFSLPPWSDKGSPLAHKSSMCAFSKSKTSTWATWTCLHTSAYMHAGQHARTRLRSCAADTDTCPSKLWRMLLPATSSGNLSRESYWNLCAGSAKRIVCMG